MKFRIITIIAISVPFLIGGSCSKKQLPGQSDVSINTVYQLDRNGSFSENESITSSQVRRFLDDLPKDAEVENVNIKALAVRIDAAQGNQVNTLKLSASLLESGAKNPVFSESNWPVPIDQEIPFVGRVGPNSLLEAGMKKLKSNIVNRLKGNEFGDFTLTASGSPVTTTGGDRLLVDITLIFDIQIEFTYCTEVWDMLDNGYPECK